MAPKTRNSDENSKGGKMVAATEAFPYELLGIEAHQQSHRASSLAGQLSEEKSL